MNIKLLEETDKKIRDNVSKLSLRDVRFISDRGIHILIFKDIKELIYIYSFKDFENLNKYKENIENIKEIYKLTETLDKFNLYPKIDTIQKRYYLTCKPNVNQLNINSIEYKEFLANSINLNVDKIIMLKDIKLYKLMNCIKDKITELDFTKFDIFNEYLKNEIANTIIENKLIKDTNLNPYKDIIISTTSLREYMNLSKMIIDISLKYIKSKQDLLTSIDNILNKTDINHMPEFDFEKYKKEKDNLEVKFEIFVNDKMFEFNAYESLFNKINEMKHLCE